MAPKRVVLLRHGQTQWNAEGRWQGRSDVSLNNVGANQAKAAAELLATQYDDICHIGSSPLLRAKETAAYLARELHLPAGGGDAAVHCDARLAEFASGYFEGLQRADIEAKYADNLAAFMAGEDVPIGVVGERPSQVAARLLTAFTEYQNSADSGTMVLVGHGGAWRILAYACLGSGQVSTGMTILRNGHWGVLVPGAGQSWEIAAWNLGPEQNLV